MSDFRLFESEDEALRQAHLLDAGSLQEIAAFLAAAIASGVAGNAVWEALKGAVVGLYRRFGDAKLDELEELVTAELKKLQRKGQHLGHEDLRLRAKELISKIRES